MLKTIGIVSAVLALQVGGVGLTMITTSAIAKHLQVSSCKYEASLSNLDSSYCEHRRHETTY
jgi:hypothetical protein